MIMFNRVAQKLAMRSIKTTERLIIYSKGIYYQMLYIGIPLTCPDFANKHILPKLVQVKSECKFFQIYIF